MSDSEEFHISNLPPDGSLMVIDESKSTVTKYWAICPYCREGRLIHKWHIDHDNWTTTSCSKHRNLPKTKWAAPGEFDETKDVVVDYTNQKLAPVGKKQRHGAPYRMVHIMATCPDCGEDRWVLVNGLRNNGLTTLCPGCAARRHILTGPDNVNWKGGSQITNGYRELHRHIIPPDLLPLLETHIGKRNYYYEHRIVALQIFGPQAIAPKMVVRHLDGDKLNNHPSNLAFGPQSANIRDHVEDRRDMKKWRRLAEKLMKENAALKQMHLKM